VAIERSGAALAQLVREQQETVDPAFPDAQALRERSATDLLSWGMQSRIPVRLLHEILMAHPGTLADRCGSLRAHWIARASRPAEP
ncbi:MAG: hypothetical protein KC729_20680, partial [Candidatus Eisenbacteria bacterium]|nr:hypothetical protein [Candidatus Eisenbacteria bacterium]